MRWSCSMAAVEAHRPQPPIREALRHKTSQVVKSTIYRSKWIRAPGLKC